MAYCRSVTLAPSPVGVRLDVRLFCPALRERPIEHSAESSKEERPVHSTAASLAYRWTAIMRGHYDSCLASSELPLPPFERTQSKEPFLAASQQP